MNLPQSIKQCPAEHFPSTSAWFSFKRPTTADSPSPALEIEGRVEGEPDNRQTESGNAFEAAAAQQQEGDFLTEDVATIIERGDMEQLAALVLNGDGAQLVGMEAKQPEIQAFLDNVPAYMVGCAD